MHNFGEEQDGTFLREFFHYFRDGVSSYFTCLVSDGAVFCSSDIMQCVHPTQRTVLNRALASQSRWVRRIFDEFALSYRYFQFAMGWLCSILLAHFWYVRIMLSSIRDSAGEKYSLEILSTFTVLLLISFWHSLRHMFDVLAFQLSTSRTVYEASFYGVVYTSGYSFLLKESAFGVRLNLFSSSGVRQSIHALALQAHSVASDNIGVYTYTFSFFGDWSMWLWLRFYTVLSFLQVHHGSYSVLWRVWCWMVGLTFCTRQFV